MIKRIVKMTFREEEVDQFLNIFAESRLKIRHFPGCSHLELWQSGHPANLFFTYSHWDSPEALESYRQSPLFQATWARTKVLFADRPEAWSVEEIASRNGQ